MARSKSSRIQSNLLQQNCFVRDVSRCDDLCSNDSESDFVSLDEVVQSDGIKLVPSLHPYPITVDSVNSQVESSDYRNDPVGAIARSVPRHNLGDIRGVQDLFSMDPVAARALYDSLSLKFSSPAGNPPADNPPADNPPANNPPEV